MREQEGSHVYRRSHFTLPDSCWNEYEFISQSSVPCLGPRPAPPLPLRSRPLCPHPPRINDCLPSFAPNHDRDAEAIENVYSDCKNPPCFHKVARFHFDGIANHRNVIYVCFELEMSPGCDIGGGPTLLGAAKPYGEFIRCIAFLSAQQIGGRLTLL